MGVVSPWADFRLGVVVFVGLRLEDLVAFFASLVRRVQILQNELIDLKRENGALEQHIAEAQSLDRLQPEALRQGFIPANPEDVTFLIVPDYPVGEGYDPFAVVPDATAVAPPIGTIEEALYLYFTRQVNALMRGEAREQ